MPIESTSSAHSAAYVAPPPPPETAPVEEKAQADAAPQEQPHVSAQAAGEVINGNASGKRLPAGTTPDGKQITRGQLAEGPQATLVREQTRADDGQGGTYVSNDQIVLTTKGNGNDKVEVNQRSDGTLQVNVNGENYEVKLAKDQEFGIRVGDGNDTITVAPNVKVNIVVDGGAGDDTITTGAGDDRVDAGSGNDTVNGGDGRDDLFGNSGDDVLDAGKGPNVVYGGDGNDRLKAAGDGSNVNFFEGGAGGDTIDASKGQNIVSGGSGNDTLISGGKNSIYTGDGVDTVSNVGANDKVYAQQGVDAISFVNGRDPGQVVVNVLLDPKLGTTGVRVEGSDSFRQRVEAEIAFLRSSPNGQQMLGEFDKVASQKGHTVVIKELANEQNGYAMIDPAEYKDIQTQAQFDKWVVGATEVSNGKAGTGVDVIINYNPSFHMDEFPAPLVVLYHEMSHAYNFTHGSMLPGDFTGKGTPDSPENNKDQPGVPFIPNSERQAVGLDTSAKPFDFDGNPSTPATTHNPTQLTENGIRRELGLPDRPSYAL